MDIPLNTPICLKAHTGNNIQFQPFTNGAKCVNTNTLAWEQMILLKTADDKIIIQSRWNNHNLQVRENGSAYFANKNQELREKFDVESNEAGQIFFVSCHTRRVLQCNKHGNIHASNENRAEWEAFTIILLVDPDHSMMTAAQLNRGILTAGLVVGGACVVPLLGLAAGALVPVAMSTFGTRVAGVGTFHAPLAALGCAAVLQVSSAALLSAGGVVAGAALGGVVNAAIQQHLED